MAKTKNSKDINYNLVRRLAQANQAIRLLKQELRVSKESWLLYMWSLIEEELKGYRWRTNPEPFPVIATYKSKPVEYIISITNIVCVIGGRDKKVYLKHPVENTKGQYHTTDVIEITDNDITFEKLCNEKLDPLRFHLVQIKKNIVINLAYYHYSNMCYTLKEQIIGHKEAMKIKASRVYLDNYKDLKMYFDDVISLQRLLSSYKDKMDSKI